MASIFAQNGLGVLGGDARMLTASAGLGDPGRAIPNVCYSADLCQPGISNYARQVLKDAEAAGQADAAYNALVGECTRSYAPCASMIANLRVHAKALAEQTEILFHQAAAILDTNAARVDQVGTLMLKRDQAGAKKIAADANTAAGQALVLASTAMKNVETQGDVVKEARGDAQTVQYAQMTQQWAGQAANAAQNARALADNARAMAEKLVALCAPDEQVSGGKCVPKGGARCPPGQSLVGGKCVKPSSVIKTCPPGQFLQSGKCVPMTVAAPAAKSNAMLYAGLAAAAVVAAIFFAKKSGAAHAVTP